MTSPLFDSSTLQVVEMSNETVSVVDAPLNLSSFTSVASMHYFMVSESVKGPFLFTKIQYTQRQATLIFYWSVHEKVK